jgi:hypothetical protein
MIDQGKYINSLVDALLKTIHEYDESIYFATAIGALELVKQQLINDAVEDEE